MYWNELSKDEKDYFRNLVTDYWKETMDLQNSLDLPEVSKGSVKKYWEDASAYYNTDDSLKFETD